MVRKSADHKIDFMEKPFGGEGTASFKRIIETPEELYGKGRVFSVATVPVGGVFGIHEHKGEEEFYYILQGKGLYYDNGEYVEVGPGDTTLCKSGEKHGITNTGDEELKYLALILFEQ